MNLGQVYPSFPSPDLCNALPSPFLPLPHHTLWFWVLQLLRTHLLLPSPTSPVCPVLALPVRSAQQDWNKALHRNFLAILPFPDAALTIFFFCSMLRLLVALSVPAQAPLFLRKGTANQETIPISSLGQLFGWLWHSIQQDAAFDVQSLLKMLPASPARSFCLAVLHVIVPSSAPTQEFTRLHWKLGHRADLG